MQHSKNHYYFNSYCTSFFYKFLSASENIQNIKFHNCGESQGTVTNCGESQGDSYNCGKSQGNSYKLWGEPGGQLQIVGRARGQLQIVGRARGTVTNCGESQGTVTNCGESQGTVTNCGESQGDNYKLWGEPGGQLQIVKEARELQIVKCNTFLNTTKLAVINIYYSTNVSQ